MKDDRVQEGPPSSREEGRKEDMGTAWGTRTRGTNEAGTRVEQCGARWEVGGQRGFILLGGQ